MENGKTTGLLHKIQSDVDVSASDEEFFCGRKALSAEEITRRIDHINIKIRKIVSMDEWTRTMQSNEERRLRNRLRMRLWRRRKKLQEELGIALGQDVNYIINERARRREQARARSKKYRERRKMFACSSPWNESNASCNIGMESLLNKPIKQEPMDELCTSTSVPQEMSESQRCLQNLMTLLKSGNIFQEELKERMDNIKRAKELFFKSKSDTLDPQEKLELFEKSLSLTKLIVSEFEQAEATGKKSNAEISLLLSALSAPLTPSKVEENEEVENVMNADESKPAVSDFLAKVSLHQQRFAKIHATRDILRKYLRIRARTLLIDNIGDNTCQCFHQHSSSFGNQEGQRISPRLQLKHCKNNSCRFSSKYLSCSCRKHLLKQWKKHFECLNVRNTWYRKNIKLGSINTTKRHELRPKKMIGVQIKQEPQDDYGNSSLSSGMQSTHITFDEIARLQKLNLQKKDIVKNRKKIMIENKLKKNTKRLKNLEMKNRRLKNKMMVLRLKEKLRKGRGLHRAGSKTDFESFGKSKIEEMEPELDEKSQNIQNIKIQNVMGSYQASKNNGQKFNMTGIAPPTPLMLIPIGHPLPAGAKPIGKTANICKDIMNKSSQNKCLPKKTLGSITLPNIVPHSQFLDNSQNPAPAVSSTLSAPGVLSLTGLSSAPMTISTSVPLQSTSMGAQCLSSLPLQTLTLGAQNLSSVPLQTLTLGSQNLSSVPLQSATLGAQNLSSVPLQSATLGAQNLSSVPLQSATLGAQNLSSVPLQSATLGAQNLPSVALQPATLEAQNLSSVPLQSATFGAQSLSTVPLQTATLGVQSLSTVPLQSATLGTQNLSSVPLQTATLGAKSKSSVTLQTSTLGAYSLSTIPLQSVTLGAQSLSTVPLQTATLGAKNKSSAPPQTSTMRGQIKSSVPLHTAILGAKNKSSVPLQTSTLEAESLSSVHLQSATSTPTQMYEEKVKRIHQEDNADSNVFFLTKEEKLLLETKVKPMSMPAEVWLARERLKSRLRMKLFRERKRGELEARGGIPDEADLHRRMINRIRTRRWREKKRQRLCQMGTDLITPSDLGNVITIEPQDNYMEADDQLQGLLRVEADSHVPCSSGAEEAMPTLSNANDLIKKLDKKTKNSATSDEGTSYAMVKNIMASQIKMEPLD